MNEGMEKIEVYEGDILLLLRPWHVYCGVLLMACGLGALWHVAVLLLSRAL